jgi:hypothetical protein
MSMSRLASLAALSAALLVPRAAAAQGESTADALFESGKSRMAAQQFAEACPLFEESYRLDPAGGTLQNLALCYEGLGLWARAHSRFVELRDRSNAQRPPRPDRVKLAQEHIDRLAPRLSRLVLELPPGGAPPGLTIRVDTTDYAEVSWTDSIVLDPGEHEVLATAPDKRPFSTRVTIGPQPAAQRVKVTIPPFVDAPRIVMATGRDAPTATLRVPGIIVGSVGVVVLAGGAFFGLLALEANQAGKDKCTRSQNPNAPQDQFDSSGRCFVNTQALNDANDDKSRARVFANVANVLVPLGAVGVGVGVYLFFRKSEAFASGVRARFVPSLGGGMIEGAF